MRGFVFLWPVRECAGLFSGRGNVSITYRGSAYEQSWETCFIASVAGFLPGDAQCLRQSTAAATATCCTSTTGPYLPDHG